MRNLFIYYFLFFCLLAAQGQSIPEAPSPMKFVNDFAGMLDQGEAAFIEKKLFDYNDSTSTQLVVVTLQSLNGYAIEEVSYKIASTWGIGQKNKNNGILLLIAPNERKIRIEVGFGHEGVLTDVRTKHIISEVISPAFKEKKYGEGILAGIIAIQETVAGTYKRDGSEKDKHDNDGGSFTTVLIILGIIILIIYISGKRGGRGGSGTTFYSGGYYYGGGGGGYSGDSGSSFDFGGGGFGGGGASGDW
ncbi:MAG: TPM domain-containing protein [Cytophagaceae bacterium]|jgi:uncharacterized protein|nr:TPM domain-containing protein [Cytophagaceae bacterium]